MLYILANFINTLICTNVHIQTYTRTYAQRGALKIKCKCSQNTSLNSQFLTSFHPFLCSQIKKPKILMNTKMQQQANKSNALWIKVI